MRKHSSFALILLVIGAFTLTGCFEEISGPYDGPDQIAFGLVNGGFSATVADTTGTVQLPVELIGPQRGQGFQVGLSVQDEVAYRIREIDQDDGTVNTDTTVLASPSTAQAGVHYSLPESISFPANANSASFPVEVLNSDLTSEESVLLTIRLEGSTADNIEPASNWRYFELTITGTDAVPAEEEPTEDDGS